MMPLLASAAAAQRRQPGSSPELDAGTPPRDENEMVGVKIYKVR
jgi:hypothetical protein